MGHASYPFLPDLANSGTECEVLITAHTVMPSTSIGTTTALSFLKVGEAIGNSLIQR